jgi:hypothetical protein
MSQEDVLNILKELGGEATTDEIREAVKKKYPTRTLSLYLLNRLRKLEINKEIEFKQGKWIIKKKRK